MTSTLTTSTKRYGQLIAGEGIEAEGGRTFNDIDPSRPAASVIGSELIPALNLPRTLFAAGALSALAAELGALGMRRPLLVTDRGLVAAGLAAE